MDRRCSRSQARGPAVRASVRLSRGFAALNSAVEDEARIAEEGEGERRGRADGQRRKRRKRRNEPERGGIDEVVHDRSCDADAAITCAFHGGVARGRTEGEAPVELPCGCERNGDGDEAGREGA